MWAENYNLLVKFYHENGHSNVPQDYDKESSLGIWINNQRKKFKNNKLSEYRIELLKQVDFQFSFYLESWKKNYDLLVEFYHKNGHSNIPYHFEENPSLGFWVVTQRQNFKNNKLSNEQIELLNQVDFKFSFDNSEIWKEKYNLLIEFYNKNGHSDIPQQYKENFSLGIWVSNQRQNFKKDKLSNEQIKLLNQVNFKYTNFDIWKEKYNLLVNFYNKNGHSNIIRKYEDNLSLGIWVNTQRQNFKKNKLSNEQIQLLNQVEFKFSLK